MSVQFYTASEVAKILRIRKSYVYELIYQGKPRAVKLSERRLRIPQEAIKELVEKESGLVDGN